VSFETNKQFQKLLIYLTIQLRVHYSNTLTILLFIFISNSYCRRKTHGFDMVVFRTSHLTFSFRASTNNLPNFVLVHIVLLRAQYVDMYCTSTITQYRKSHSCQIVPIKTLNYLSTIPLNNIKLRTILKLDMTL
jgi:hypothetical protein